MTFEQLVGEALHAADAFEPSPDLFAKVRRSIDEDLAHRRRLRRVATISGIGAVATVLYLLLTVDVVDRTVSMPFRALELLVTALMICAVLVLGPAIRRFGELYERAAFRGAPETGTHVLRLLDIAYYLIFSAYIIMSLVFDPALEFGAGLASWVRGEFVRLGGLLLLMGVLHVVLLLALPIVGLVNGANERRMRIAAGRVSVDPIADRADRIITVMSWVLAGFVVADLVLGALNWLLILGAPG